MGPATPFGKDMGLIGGLFRRVPAEQMRLSLMRLCIMVDIVLALVVLGIGDRGEACIAAAAFLGFVAVLRASTRGLRDPLLALFWLSSAVFIEIPSACFGALPARFTVDHGLAVELARPSDPSVCEALLHLACCYVAVIIAAIVIMPAKRTGWPILSVRRASVATLVMLVVSVLYDRYFVVPFEHPTVRSVFEILKIVCYDAAMVTFWIAAFATAGPGDQSRAQAQGWAFAGACGGFLVLHTFNGSKGAILVLVFLALGMPLALALFKPGSLLVVPRPRLLVAIAIVALPLFALAEELRTVRNYGVEFTAEPIALLNERMTSGELAETAAIRLSAPYLRYQAVYDRFREGNGLAGEASREYAGYSLKSLVNLFAPGSPFPDAYAPSSMVLEQLLTGSPLEAPDRDSLKQALNTQPTSAFGFFFITLGWWAPIACLVSMLILRAIASLGLLSAVFAVSMLQCGLSSYGMEVAVLVSVSFTMTFAMLLWFARAARSRRCAQCVRGTPPSAPLREL